MAMGMVVMIYVYYFSNQHLFSFILKMKVDQWLQSLYASSDSSLKNGGAPSYEKTKISSEILTELKKANQQADVQAEQEIEALGVLQKEYSAECRNVLNAFYLSKFHTIIFSGERLSSIIHLVFGADSKGLPGDIWQLAAELAPALENFKVLSDMSETVPESCSSPQKQTENLQRLQNLEKYRECLLCNQQSSTSYLFIPTQVEGQPSRNQC